MCSSARARSAKTRTRDSRAELTSNDGFSVVAPISVTVPFSTCGSTASCWFLLKRWISSMNRIVRRVRQLAGEVDGLAQVGDASGHRRHGQELRSRQARDHIRQRRLAGARRAPQHHAGHAIGVERPAQRAAGRQQVVLTHDLVQAARPHAGRERHARGRVTVTVAVEQFGLCAHAPKVSPSLNAHRKSVRASHRALWHTACAVPDPVSG